MNEYERGFEEGERDGYRDRQCGRLATRPPWHPDHIGDVFTRGYWDGYRPRTREWRDGAREFVEAM